MKSPTASTPPTAAARRRSTSRSGTCFRPSIRARRSPRQRSRRMRRRQPHRPHRLDHRRRWPRGRRRSSLTPRRCPPTSAPGGTSSTTPGSRGSPAGTNLGGSVTYTPADNIDPNNDTTPNAPAADDPSNVKTAGAAIAKTQTTEVNEGGNNAATQATIGEKVNYTLTATVPEGTTLGGSAEITDTVSSTERLSYVTGSAAATLNGVAVPGDLHARRQRHDAETRLPGGLRERARLGQRPG